jgi:hypothetical protein
MIDIMVILVALVITGFGLAYFAAYVLYTGIKNKVFGTMPRSGTLEIVVAGSTADGTPANPVETIPNISGYHVVKDCELLVKYFEYETKDGVRVLKEKPNEAKIKLAEAVIPTSKSHDQISLFEILKEGTPALTKSKTDELIIDLFKGLGLISEGNLVIRWVNLFPVKRIGRFTIVKARLKGEQERGESILYWIDTDKPEEVDNFVWRSQRPVIVKDVELADGSRAHFIVIVVIQFVSPVISAFVWGKKFYQQVESQVQGAINDWGKGLSYDALISADKGPSSNFFAEALSKLNVMGTANLGQGLLAGYGCLLVQGWIEAYEISKEDEAILKAKRSREEELRKGQAEVAKQEQAKQARVIKAQAELEAAKLEAEADAMRIARLMEASKGSIDVVVERLKVDQRQKTPGLATIVEDKTKTGVVINIPATENPATPPK